MVLPISCILYTTLGFILDYFVFCDYGQQKIIALSVTSDMFSMMLFMNGTYEFAAHTEFDNTLDIFHGHGAPVLTGEQLVTITPTSSGVSGITKKSHAPLCTCPYG